MRRPQAERPGAERMELVAEERERVASPTPAVFRPLVMVSVTALAVIRGELCALLSPYPAGGPGMHSLPRRNPGTGESLDGAAARELTRLCGAPGYFEQLYTWSELGLEERLAASAPRDGQTLEVSYLAPCAAHTDFGKEPKAPAGSLPTPMVWHPIRQLPRMVPGHAEIVGYAHRRLSRKLSYTNIAVNLLPPEFTLSELQTVYEVIRGQALDKRNFRKWIFATGFIEATAHERRFGAHRPARLYQFVSRDLQRID